MKKYVCSTGLLANHRIFKTAKLVTICAEIDEAGNVEMHAASGHNLAVIKQLGKIKLTAEKWDDRPRDPYDDIKFTKWAFEQFGLKIA